MPPTLSDRSRGSETVTEGIRVRVRPEYLPGHSEPDHERFIFAYHIHIANEGQVPARLVRRHWEIVDAEGERHVVDDEGVIGQQPNIRPGEVFDYSSYCPIPTTWGTMEGWYSMTRPTGEEFRAVIGRFYLVSPDAPS